MPEYTSDQSFWDVEQYAKKKSSPGQGMLFDVGEEVKHKPLDLAPAEQKHVPVEAETVVEKQLGIPGVAGKELAKENQAKVDAALLAKRQIAPRQTALAASEAVPLSKDEAPSLRVETGKPSAVPQKVAETFKSNFELPPKPVYEQKKPEEKKATAISVTPELTGAIKGHVESIPFSSESDKKKAHAMGDEFLYALERGVHPDLAAKQAKQEVARTVTDLASDPAQSDSIKAWGRNMIGLIDKWRASTPSVDKSSASEMPSADISPEKAKTVLKHGEVKGHELTEKQKGMFGAAAGKADKADASCMPSNYALQYDSDVEFWR